jgi:predicted DNA-binding protein (UPF0251 family)
MSLLEDAECEVARGLRTLVEAGVIPKQEVRSEAKSGGPQGMPVLKLRKRRKRRPSDKKPTSLTAKQVEAMQLVGEYKGNVAAAARAAGKSRQAMQKLYNKALAKLGKDAPKLIKIQALPSNSRGQRDVPDPNGPKVPARPRRDQKLELDD